MVKIKKNDFIRITFTLKIQDSGQIIETTDEDIAKKANIFDEKNSYGQRLLIVGNEEMYLKKMTEAFIDKEVGNKFQVAIPPEDTFGFRDPKKVKMLGRKELVAKNIVPEIGKQIQWGNQSGVVRSIMGGRVRVDFNHPLVGQTIVYDVEIKERITSDKKKIDAIIDYRMPGVELSKFTIQIENTKISISMPEEITTKDPYIHFRKIRIANDINKSFPDCKEVIFIDSFTFGEKK